MSKTIFTMGEAAKATGYAKSKISKDINSGKLSATRDDIHGPYKIDASELIRVYGGAFKPDRGKPGPGTDAVNGSRDGQERLRTLENAEIDLLKERLAMAATLHDAEISQLNARIEDLRASRDDANAQRDRAMTLLTEQIAVTRQLTDQRGRDNAIPMPGPAETAMSAPQRGRGLFGLFGRRSG